MEGRRKGSERKSKREEEKDLKKGKKDKVNSEIVEDWNSPMLESEEAFSILSQVVTKQIEIESTLMDQNSPFIQNVNLDEVDKLIQTLSKNIKENTGAVQINNNAPNILKNSLEMLENKRKSEEELARRQKPASGFLQDNFNEFIELYYLLRSCTQDLQKRELTIIEKKEVRQNKFFEEMSEFLQEFSEILKMKKQEASPVLIGGLGGMIEKVSDLLDEVNPLKEPKKFSLDDFEESKSILFEGDSLFEGGSLEIEQALKEKEKIENLKRNQIKLMGRIRETIEELKKEANEQEEDKPYKEEHKEGLDNQDLNFYKELSYSIKESIAEVEKSNSLSMLNPNQMLENSSRLLKNWENLKKENINLLEQRQKLIDSTTSSIQSASNQLGTLTCYLEIKFEEKRELEEDCLSLKEACKIREAAKEELQKEVSQLKMEKSGLTDEINNIDDLNSRLESTKEQLEICQNRIKDLESPPDEEKKKESNRLEDRDSFKEIHNKRNGINIILSNQSILKAQESLIVSPFSKSLGRKLGLFKNIWDSMSENQKLSEKPNLKNYGDILVIDEDFQEEKTFFYVRCSFQRWEEPEYFNRDTEEIKIALENVLMEFEELNHQGIEISNIAIPILCNSPQKSSAKSIAEMYSKAIKQFCGDYRWMAGKTIKLCNELLPISIEVNFIFRHCCCGNL